MPIASGSYVTRGGSIRALVQVGTGILGELIPCHVHSVTTLPAAIQRCSSTVTCILTTTTTSVVRRMTESRSLLRQLHSSL